MAPAADEAVPPPPPYYVLGYVYDAGGAVVPYSTVTITNVNTSVLVVVNSDNNGFYTYNLNDIPGGWEIGNIINVTAQKDLAIGWNESAAVEGPYLWIDVHMGFVIPEFPTLILPAAGMLAIFAAVQFRRRSEQA
ncbi:MAG: carboxypeptidase-like regulatory domain-containing protein [Phycisphaerae bacterium]